MSPNMIGRANATGTQTLTFDVENRLSQVDGTGGGYSGTATYVYDGDGNRIKKTEGGSTVVYPNKYYEKNVTSDVITSHYYLGGQQIAIKKGSTLEYLHQDSLNSSSLSTDDDGAQVSKTVFYPFGDCRNSTGTLGTDQLYTGQRLDGTGLYFYNARYYDASIGRFISPDSTGQTLTNPQTVNRYTYVVNNPLRYTDPTGHVNVSDDGGGGIRQPSLFERATGAVRALATNMADAVKTTARTAGDAGLGALGIGEIRQFSDPILGGHPVTTFVAQDSGLNLVNNVLDKFGGADVRAVSIGGPVGVLARSDVTDKELKHESEHISEQRQQGWSNWMIDYGIDMVGGYVWWGDGTDAYHQHPAELRAGAYAGEDQPPDPTAAWWRTSDFWGGLLDSALDE